MLRRARIALFALSTVFTACNAGMIADPTPPMTPEPTRFRLRIANVALFEQLKSGAFNTRVGAASPSALTPGDAYEVPFSAGPGQRLSFAVMLGASNDWVFATPPGGIDLFSGDSHTPVSGDVTSSVSLWDVGTELDEEPGVGPHTGPNQAGSGDGPGAPDPVNRVRKLGSTVTLSSGASFGLPPVASMIRVTLTPRGRDFVLRIENVADDSSTLMTSQGAKPVRLSPGVWALASDGNPLFTDGQPDRGLGLEAIAEMGSPDMLAAALRPLTGLATPVSPGVVVVHHAGAPLFTLGERDRGQGLERLAEDGNAGPLRQALGASGDPALLSVKLFDTAVGRDTTGPAKPGSAYELAFDAVPGDRLSFVTMFGWSNDWVFATPEDGVPLFDADQPRFGPLTDDVGLYDVGTELSEEPAVGPDTGPQQSAPDTGAADTDPRVRRVTGAEYGTPVSHHLEVWLSPEPTP